MLSILLHILHVSVLLILLPLFVPLLLFVSLLLFKTILLFLSLLLLLLVTLLLLMTFLLLLLLPSRSLGRMSWLMMPIPHAWIVEVVLQGIDGGRERRRRLSLNPIKQFVLHVLHGL